MRAAIRRTLSSSYVVHREYRLLRLSSESLRLRDREPLLVYQMGKVGSTAVARALDEACPGRPLYHLHTLQRDRVARSCATGPPGTGAGRLPAASRGCGASAALDRFCGGRWTAARRLEPGPVSNPHFSVILPTFNRARLLPRAVRSVLSQEHRDFELLIVDDGSTDETSEALAAFGDPRIHRLRQKNRGVSAARNLGLRHARGNAVIFLDSDDEASPDWLATFGELLADPRVGIATSGARVIVHGPNGAELAREVVVPRVLGPLYGQRKFSYTAGALAARRELFESIGGYAEPLRFAENAEMAMRLVPACTEHGLEMASVERPLVTYYRDYSGWTVGRAAFESMRDGAEYILEHHEGRLARSSPWVVANYRSVAAVNAARLNDVKAARRHLLAAIRVEPRRWRTYLRLALTLSPPLAKYYWTRHGDRGGLGDRL